MCLMIITKSVLERIGLVATVGSLPLTLIWLVWILVAMLWKILRSMSGLKNWVFSRLKINIMIIFWWPPLMGLSVNWLSIAWTLFRPVVRLVFLLLIKKWSIFLSTKLMSLTFGCGKKPRSLLMRLMVCRSEALSQSSIVLVQFLPVWCLIM